MSKPTALLCWSSLLWLCNPCSRPASPPQGAWKGRWQIQPVPQQTEIFHERNAKWAKFCKDKSGESALPDWPLLAPCPLPCLPAVPHKRQPASATLSTASPGVPWRLQQEQAAGIHLFLFIYFNWNINSKKAMNGMLNMQVSLIMPVSSFALHNIKAQSSNISNQGKESYQ